MSNNEASDFYVAGNDAFIEEDFDKAKELYTKAIEVNPNNALYFDRRSSVYIKSQQYIEAAKDATSALALDPSLHSALLSKGTALFYMDNFFEAKVALTKAEELGNKKCSLLIRKCDAETHGNGHYEGSGRCGHREGARRTREGARHHRGRARSARSRKS